MAALAISCVMILVVSTQAYSINNTLDQTIGPVQFVSIWYRHGQRGPIMSIPGFEVTYPNYWPRGYGELTTQGLQGHYQLGQWLRHRYDNLITPTGHLSFETLSVVSSDLNRCVQSAQANLAGMFPPSVDDQWGPLDWLPIPMTTQSDNVFNIPYQSCSSWSEEYNQVLESADYAAAVNQYSNLLTQCQSIFNTTWGMTDPIELAGYLWAQVPIADLDALPMTEDERNFYESLNEPNYLYFYFRMYTASMKRVGGYPLTQWIIDDLTNARNNLSQALISTTPMKKFSIYSVKDNTLAGILNSLNITMTMSPLPTATLLFELRVAPNGTDYVTILYRNSYDLSLAPVLVELPGCSYPCTLTQFLSIMQTLIPTNWEQECSSTSK